MVLLASPLAQASLVSHTWITASHFFKLLFRFLENKYMLHGALWMQQGCNCVPRVGRARQLSGGRSVRSHVFTRPCCTPPPTLWSYKYEIRIQNCTSYTYFDHFYKFAKVVQQNIIRNSEKSECGTPRRSKNASVADLKREWTKSSTRNWFTCSGICWHFSEGLR